VCVFLGGALQNCPLTEELHANAWVLRPLVSRWPARMPPVRELAGAVMLFLQRRNPEVAYSAVQAQAFAVHSLLVRLRRLCRQSRGSRSPEVASLKQMLVVTRKTCAVHAGGPDAGYPELEDEEGDSSSPEDSNDEDSSMSEAALQVYALFVGEVPCAACAGAQTHSPAFVDADLLRTEPSTCLLKQIL